MIAAGRPGMLGVFAILAIAAAGIAWRMNSAEVSDANARTACTDADRERMIVVPGGSALLGGSDAADDAPVRRVTLPAFRMSATEVTNAQFSAFVRATGYRTVAERAPRPQDYPGVPRRLLVPGSAVFTPPGQVGDPSDISQWWSFTPGANWRHPTGPDSDLRGRENHPVVHIAYDDALAYAQWRRQALPTEDQWELAARGGLNGRRYAWGDDLVPDGRHSANVWQGTFPLVDTGEDGFRGLGPVGCFEANAFGLHDMIGNVWEWTSSTDPRAPGTRLIKGGSFLCAPNHCARYRPAARQNGDPSLGASHIGFRTVMP